ncbi:MAG: T9SS type A sorting domain-containing protein [Flavobacteriales bacterium]
MSKYISLLLVLRCLAGQAQNLVPNGDFETILQEPCSYLGAGEDIGNYTANWHSPTLGSPDYFSRTGLCFQIPNTQEGYAETHGGDHMAGLIHHSESNATGDADCPLEATEYLQVQLAQPLQLGAKYSFKVWLMLSENSLFACDHLAFAFTESAPSEPSNVCPFPIQADITLLAHIPNTWTLVDTTFNAASAAEYLTIGRFSPQALTDCVSLGGTARSYYFIDDISLAPDEETSMSEAALAEMRPAVNPVDDELTLLLGRTLAGARTVELYSVAGQCIHRSPTAAERGSVRVDVRDLAPGLYVARIMDDEGIRSVSFIKR